MRAISEELAQLADAIKRPLAELANQYIMEGALRRLSSSAQAEAFVLRGGMLTRIWVGPERRAAEDLDFLCLYPFDVAETVTRLRRILRSEAAVNDSIQFDEESITGEATWQETDFPGVRINGRALLGQDEYSYRVDCGFNDPLSPPAVWFDYPSLLGGQASARVLSCRVETAIGWKLHGLVDYGARRWRPKDLYDLFLLGEYTPLSPDDLAAAIRTAFVSRETPLEAALLMFDSIVWWKSDRSLKKWRDFSERANPSIVAVDLEQAVARVSRYLRPLVERCLRGA
ncbi:MAG TPA: nucleotidyl transferase AbiEii/AbiGii toxin family protein [Pyrinomonadaceae bacterium]|nr:nucleotidyl transferase AbiEii/AbiGii toxin family protein [Pyrinomonadaceae bacterium]